MVIVCMLVSMKELMKINGVKKYKKKINCSNPKGFSQKHIVMVET